jgi:S-adenosylmethionine-diacylglycerol 3-amino-3-carboxypropyl transferase
MAKTLSLTDKMHQRFFSALYSRSLLYNTCWEDPAIDHQALNLNAQSTIAMITSAGCNALDYALASPKHIYAIDANPKQNAVLELKMAGIRSLDFDDFFALFGRGQHEQCRPLYHAHLRQHLSAPSRAFWDEHMSWFSNNGVRNSFYYHGLSGLVAYSLALFLRCRPALRRAIKELLEARTLTEQQEIYDRKVAPLFWNRGMRFAVSNRVTMSLLGVPHAQTHAVADSHNQGIAGFIEESLRFVFREIPLADNYFWQVYLRGHYTPECCPSYLQYDNFMALKNGGVDRITPVTSYVTNFLDTVKQPISHFVLLDHMDWMAHHAPKALQTEWDAIDRASGGSARILFRSAAPSAGFLDHITLPSGAKRVALNERLHYNRQLAEQLHTRDRVHTYASFHIADLAA